MLCENTLTVIWCCALFRVVKASGIMWRKIYKD